MGKSYNHRYSIYSIYTIQYYIYLSYTHSKQYAIATAIKCCNYVPKKLSQKHIFSCIISVR